MRRLEADGSNPSPIPCLLGRLYQLRLYRREHCVLVF